MFIKLFDGVKPHNYIYFNTKVCIYKAWIFHSPKLLVTSSDYHPNGESCSRTTTSFVLLHVCALKMCAMYYACSLYQVQYGSRKMGKKVQKKTQKRLKDNLKNLKIVRWPRQAGMWHFYKKISSNKKILYWKKNFCNRNKMRLHFWNSCLEKKLLFVKKKRRLLIFFKICS